MQRLLTFEDLVAAGYVSNRVTLARRISRGEFPAPIKVSARSVAWLKREVDEWEADRIIRRDGRGKTCANVGALQRDNQGETAATIRMRDAAGQPSGEGRA